eukprot:Hpha_TRINITY_DN36201_c0_g1::TRINITY_DN36201_c0_g1_i1::g.83282::m.83282
MGRGDVADMLTAMLEKRQTGPAASGGRQEWERERVGGDFGEFKYTTEGGEAVVISEGFHDIGHRIWDCCTQFCKMLERKGELKGKRVLELGAGCGLLSIIASKLGAERVVATDLPVVVEHMQKNVEMSGTAVKCEPLVWGEPIEEGTASAEAYDLVLACDVTLEAAVVPLLLQTLEVVLARRPGTYAVVAGARHRDGWPVLVATAPERFTITPVGREEMHPDYISDKIDIIRMSLKSQ